MRKRRPTERQIRWWRSAEFREISRRAIRAWNAKRIRGLRCGAKRKSDGEPCQGWPLQNGRCRIHGGLTPRGDQWHRIQYPASLEKLNRKLRDHERRARQRTARLAAMTPAERAAYEAWRVIYRPGTVSARAAARERRKQDREARRLLERCAKAPQEAPGAFELNAMIGETPDIAKRAGDSLKADSGISYGGVFE